MMDGQIKEIINENFKFRKIREMWSNWMFLKDKSFQQNLTLIEYHEITTIATENLINTDLYKKIINPIWDKINNIKEFYNKNMFFVIQEQVFKILNILDKKEQLEKDFKEYVKK